MPFARIERAVAASHLSWSGRRMRLEFRFVGFEAARLCTEFLYAWARRPSRLATLAPQGDARRRTLMTRPCLGGWRETEVEPKFSCHPRQLSGGRGGDFRRTITPLSPTASQHPGRHPEAAAKRPSKDDSRYAGACVCRVMVRGSLRSHLTMRGWKGHGGWTRG